MICFGVSHIGFISKTLLIYCDLFGLIRSLAIGHLNNVTSVPLASIKVCLRKLSLNSYSGDF